MSADQESKHHPYCIVIYNKQGVFGWQCECGILKDYDKWKEGQSGKNNTRNEGQNERPGRKTKSSAGKTRAAQHKKTHGPDDSRNE